MKDTTKKKGDDHALRATLAANLIRFRGERGWSQEVLALESGLHRTFVGHVERQARNISLDNIEKLARALDVQPFELLKEHKSTRVLLK